MILVTFALPEESKDFVARLANLEWRERGRLPVVRGEINGRKILVCHTGVGLERAAAKVTALLAQVRCEQVISAGFGGGLDPRVAAGQVVIGVNYSTAELVEKARSISGEAFCGPISTQPEIAETAEAKRKLFGETGAAAVDMETVAIFTACEERSIPMLSVRAISDAAGDDLPVPYAVWFDAATQRPRVGSLLFFLATHPGRIPAFARFVGNVGKARRALTGFLAAYCQIA